MTSIQRVRYVFEGLMMMLCVAILLMKPGSGYQIIGFILSVVLIVNGLRSLFYYFTMARHMVGGRIILFRGMIALDLGLFAYTLQDIPPLSILLYLLIANLFSGVLAVLRAAEAKQMESPWKLSMAFGIANILLAISCAFCFRSLTLLTYVYAAGLFYSACLHIAQAFRKTAIVYIP